MRISTRTFTAGLALPAMLFVAAGCPKSGSSLPAPGSEAYVKTVSSFTIGTVALETVNLDLIEPNLRAASELAPGEPAIWANLAIHALRTANLAAAEGHFQKAKALGGDDDRLILIEGLLAEKRGRFDDALAAYRRAAERNPRNVKAHFLVAKTADAQSAPDKSTVMGAALDAILAITPGNQMALTERLKVAAEAGDLATVRRVVDFFKVRAKSLPEASLGLLKALDTAPDSMPKVARKRQATLFQNTLRPLADFQAGLREVTFEGTNIGQPLPRFLKMANPPATAAAPDTALTYTVAASPVAGTTLAAFALDEKQPPVLFGLSPDSIRTARTALPAAIRPASMIAFDLDDEVGHVPTDDDRKYRLDLAVAGPGGLRLFLSQGESLKDVTGPARLPAGIVGGAWTGTWTIDIEGDGDLDLVLSGTSGAPVVLQNNGNSTFQPVSKSPFAGASCPIRSLAWCDIDADGDPDAFLVDASGALRVFVNERSGLFRPRPAPALPGKSVSLAVIEANGDTTLDVVALGVDGGLSRISDSGDGKAWAEVISLGKAEIAKPARLLSGDLDNNGQVDFAVAGADTTAILLGADGAKFSPLSATIPMVASDVVDTDADGVLDFVGVAEGKPVVAKGKSTKAYGWQAFTLRAKKPNSPTVKINAFAIGGEVETRAGLLYQKRPIAGPQVHVGLGEAKTLDIARVVWPSGAAQSEAGKDLVAGPMVADQRLTGSCPFLFTWDGDRMVFVTDCIWRSPLGLKINAVDTAGVTQTEDWVKVRGDQLRAKDGAYPVSITAELQETHFFDKVALMTVDHPAGTDIWVDERFSPTAPPRLEVIGTKTPSAFAAVRGNRGQDVSDAVSDRDGVYVDDFGRTKYQGIAGDHGIELRLPESAPRGKTLYLIASGWLHPTDTSVNVALSQDPSMPPPSGLMMQVPDGKSGWKSVRQGLGFPAGKLKTVVLRIDDVLPDAGDRRLRLRTNLEIYWDQLRWAEAIPANQLVVQSSRPATAELRFRGFSDVRAKDASSPELPVSYAGLAGAAPVWRDLEGFHTRFGDVLPLVRGVDDRYVIMNAGDELALRFPERPAPRNGAVRDFVFVGDGWEKDGNINTTYGRTVLPLPSHGIKDYRTPPSTLENDPVYRRHRADWETYHTRYVTPRAFAAAMRP